MSAPSTSGLSVELLLRVIDVKYGYFTLLLLFNNGYGGFPLATGGMGRKHGGHRFKG